jgi:glycerol transport system ATP-binding protein
MARVELQSLSHSYMANPSTPADWAVKPMTMIWEDGGAYALLGPSGCGKTTLLNIISGLVIPSRGKVLFDGVDVTGLPTEKRNIAQVFQFPVIYDTMTVAQNFAFPLRNRGVPGRQIDARVHAVASMLGLTGELNRIASGLTADMKQKVSLGRGIVRDDVCAVLFDEPLTVIDPHLKWQLRGELRRVHRESNTTMLYVTHDQTEALTFADKVVVMHDGEVVQIGTPQELFERPEHTFVGHFIGSPGMNVLPASVDVNVARVDGVDVPLGQTYPDLAGRGRIEIGVRPEFLRVRSGVEGLPAVIRRVDDAGRYKIVRGEFNGIALAALLDEDESVPESDVRFVADPAHIHVYADGVLVRS